MAFSKLHGNSLLKIASAWDLWVHVIICGVLFVCVMHQVGPFWTISLFLSGSILFQILPLRFISRRWGELTSVELPMWLRPYVYKGWARAFNSNLEEALKPIEEYPSLRAFFTRELKEGARPLAIGPTNLISPVDAIVIRCGQIQGSSTMIEQVTMKEWWCTMWM